MARPTWSGSISFGLVNIPVKAYTAVHDHEVHFHQLEARTGARIRYAKVSAKTGKPVDNDAIDRAFEVSKGEFVVVDDEELERLRPRSTRTVDITDFVRLEDIDPIYYEHTYWLGVGDDEAGRAYRLLLDAMVSSQRAGIGTVVMRNKQYLAAIRPADGALAMSTMHFADEIVPRKSVDGIPAARSKPPPRERRLAEQIVESLASDWNPKRYHDTYTEELRDLIRRKDKGDEVTTEPVEEEATNVTDLMAALEASLEKRRTRGAAHGRPSRRKKSA